MTTWLKKYTHWALAFVIMIAGLVTAAIIDMARDQQAVNTQSALTKSQTQPFDGSVPYQNNGPDATDDNFFVSGAFQSISQLKDERKPTVVWISASWCQVCHEMRKFIWKSANTYSNDLVIKEIDFVENYDTIVLPNYLFGTPTFLVLDTTGKITHTFYGADEPGFNAELVKIASI